MNRKHRSLLPLSSAFLSTGFLASLLVATAAAADPAAAKSEPAEQFQRTYEFSLHDWHEIDRTDGAVTLHRFRIEPKTGRIDRSALFRSKGQQHLQTVVFQMEYTNEASSKWKAKVEVSWLDEEGNVIDGFSATDDLSKKSARKIFDVTIPTLRYGLDRAKSLEVQIHFTP